MISIKPPHIRHIFGENSCQNNHVKAIKGWKNFSRASKDSIFKVKKIGGNGIFLLLIPAGTFCLGTWQVQRRKWKLDLIEELETKTREVPIPFPDNPDELKYLEYRKVKIHGVFEHDKEMYLGPRSLLRGGDVMEVGGGIMASGRSGYNVITPFILSNTKLQILVNRGWVPRKSKDPSTRLIGQVSVPVELTGVVRGQEVRAPFMPENIKNSNLFCYRDVTTMAQMTDSAPILLDIVETLDGGPQGSQTRVTLRNEHLSYILTWYSLSTITAFLWFRKFVLRKPLV